MQIHFSLETGWLVSMIVPSFKNEFKRYQVEYNKIPETKRFLKK